MEIGSRRIEQPGWHRGLQQPHIHFFQQIGFVVARLNDIGTNAAMMGRGQGNGTIEGIVAGQRGELFRFQLRCCRRGDRPQIRQISQCDPIRQFLVVLHELTTAL